VFIPITCSLTPCLLLHNLSCNTVVTLLRYSFQHWDGLLFNPSSLTAHQRWPTVTLCAIIASRLTQWLNLPLAKAVVISSPAVPFFWILLKTCGRNMAFFFYWCGKEMKNLGIPGNQKLRVNLFGVQKLPIISARLNSIFSFGDSFFNTL